MDNIFSSAEYWDVSDFLRDPQTFSNSAQDYELGSGLDLAPLMQNDDQREAGNEGHLTTNPNTNFPPMFDMNQVVVRRWPRAD
jgi:hypothetical protein